MNSRASSLFIVLSLVALIVLAGCKRSQKKVEPLSPAVSQIVPIVEAIETERIKALEAEKLKALEKARQEDNLKYCPEGMVHVEGEYCTKLSYLCLAGHITISLPKKPKGAPDSWKASEQDYKNMSYQEWPEGISSTGVYFCKKFKEGSAKCEGERIHMDFCMDVYEYPNKKGEKPRVWISWYESRDVCKAEGKRICTEHESNLACEGKEELPYSYGWNRDPSKCPIGVGHIPPVDADKLAPPQKDSYIQSLLDDPKVDTRVPSGTYEGCVSPYGVRDMTGNVDEWVSGQPLSCMDFNKCEHRSTSLFSGGHNWGEVRNQCRPKTAKHGKFWKLIINGTRCCKDVKQQ